MEKLTTKFKSKPTYELYSTLWYTLDTYLLITTRIDSYIFFKYNNWNLKELNNINSFTKVIFEYDYKVFKTLLYLYWDLEYYLEGADYVKNTLMVDCDNVHFFNIKFKNNIKSYTLFLEQIQNKESMNLWENLENRGMFDDLLEYEVYFNIILNVKTLYTKHKTNFKKKEYKLYKKFNDLISPDYIVIVRKQLSQQIETSYYSSYIENWYKEWFSELNEDASLKHWLKIKELKFEFKNLIESLNKIENINIKQVK
jgi:hypothetical protein